MMAEQDQHPELAEYLAGDGSGAEEQAVEAHLAECSDCRREVDEIREMERLLRDVPPEALVDGPAEDGDLLLGRTLRELRAYGEAPRPRTNRRTATLLIAAASAVVVLVGGVIIGRASVPESSPIAAPPTSMPMPPPVPGTRYLNVVDTHTGARVEAHIVPMAGWVRVHADVAGVPAGQPCRLVVVGTDGRREIAGSWLVSPQGAKNGTTLMGAAVVNPAQVRALVVENTSGQQFVQAQV